MSVPWFRLLGYLFFVLFFINVLTESYGLSNNQFKSASNTSNLLITNGKLTSALFNT